MPLNDTAFKAEIISLQDEMMEATDYQAAKVVYANKLTQAIKNYIMSGTVSVEVTVSTFGNQYNQTGGGSGTGTIS